MFKMNKALALANAAVTLPDAVMQSYRNVGGYPWGLIPAGIMAATGAAQISAIKGTSFGGGGSGTTPSAAGSVPTVNDIPVLANQTNQQAAPVPIVVNATLAGGLYDDQAVRNFIEAINGQVGDGVQLNVTVSS